MQIPATPELLPLSQIDAQWAPHSSPAPSFPSTVPRRHRPDPALSGSREIRRWIERAWKNARSLWSRSISGTRELAVARIARSAERGEAVILGSITNTWNVEARNHETARSPLSVLEKFVGLDLRLVVDSPALLQWLTLLGELDRQNAVEITYVVREEDPVQVAQGLAVVRTLAEQGIWVRLAVRLGSREPRDIDALFEKACSAGACDIELFGESAALWSDEARRLRLRWSLPVVPSGRG